MVLAILTATCRLYSRDVNRVISFEPKITKTVRMYKELQVQVGNWKFLTIGKVLFLGEMSNICRLCLRKLFVF